MSSDPHADWRRRHERRTASVSAPYGPLSLTGTLPQTPSGGTPSSPITRTGEFRPSPVSGVKRATTCS